MTPTAQQTPTQSSGTVSEEEIRQLVIARLRTLPSDRKISIGSDGEFTREELINRVEKDDEVGKKIIEIQLTYLRTLKDILDLDK